MRMGQLQEAEEHFRHAADAQAGESGGLYDLGNIYLRRSKYREAIDCFERLMPNASRGTSFVPQLLAEAYVGAGDEARAVHVLDRLGMSAQQIATEVEQYRQNVSRRKVQ